MVNFIINLNYKPFEALESIFSNRKRIQFVAIFCLGHTFITHTIWIVNLAVHWFFLAYLFIYCNIFSSLTDLIVFRCISVNKEQHPWSWRRRNIFLSQLNAIVMSICGRWLWKVSGRCFNSPRRNRGRSVRFLWVVVGGVVLFGK